MIYYILDKGVPRAVESEEWLDWMETNPDRTVAKTVVGEVEISTVFLSLNHNFGFYGSPILYETMIFGGEHDQYQERYTALEDAMLGHNRAVILAGGMIVG